MDVTAIWGLVKAVAAKLPVIDDAIEIVEALKSTIVTIAGTGTVSEDEIAAVQLQVEEAEAGWAAEVDRARQETGSGSDA